MFSCIRVTDKTVKSTCNIYIWPNHTQKYVDQIFSATWISTFVISVSVLRHPATTELFLVWLAGNLSASHIILKMLFYIIWRVNLGSCAVTWHKRVPDGSPHKHKRLYRHAVTFNHLVWTWARVLDARCNHDATCRACVFLWFMYVVCVYAFARECTVALQYLYYQCVMLIQDYTYIYAPIGECAYVYVRVCVQLSWCKCCPISSRSLSFCSLSIRWRVGPRGAIVWAAVEDKQGRRRTHRLPWQHSRALQSLTPQPFNIHKYHPSLNICMRLLTHIAWEINKGSHDRLSWQVYGVRKMSTLPTHTRTKHNTQRIIEEGGSSW